MLAGNELFDASQSIPVPGTDYGLFQPTADGVEATTHPWISLSNGQVADVPILHGTNTDEGSMFCPLNHNATSDQLDAYWRSGGFTDDAIVTLRQLYVDGKRRG